MARLIVDSLDVRYASHIVLHNASLEVEAGSISGLLGPARRTRGPGSGAVVDLANFVVVALAVPSLVFL